MGTGVTPQQQEQGWIIGPIDAGDICPADVDGNGQVEPADIALFVSQWFTSIQNGTLEGDFDGNGSVQPSDVAAFVSVWFTTLTTSPCP